MGPFRGGGGSEKACELDREILKPTEDKRILALLALFSGEMQRGIFITEVMRFDGGPNEKYLSRTTRIVITF